MQPATLIALLALAVSAAVAQQYSGNYVDSDYDYQEPAPRPSPPPRSYSRPAPAPVRHSAPAGPRPTPVPILKQINRHNEDGSYTYGYEGADGSFKIETKLQTGEVMGKYGYVDDVGKVRVVEYGANKFGFQPSGEGITVAPPTLVDESTRRKQPGDSQYPEYDDGQYYQPPAPVRPAHRPAPRPAPRPSPPPPPPPPQPSRQQSFSYDSYQDEQEYSAPRPRPAPRLSQGPPSLSQGPTPPRAVVVPGASLAGPQGGVTYAQPRPVPPPSRPAPVYQQQEAPSRPRPAPQARQAGSGSFLDQLARDYALPQGGSQPLTDISFSSY